MINLESLKNPSDHHITNLLNEIRKLQNEQYSIEEKLLKKRKELFLILDQKHSSKILFLK